MSSPAADTETGTPEHSFGSFLRKPRRELLAVVLVFAMGILLRVNFAPDGGFDRESDGFQGGSFAIFMVNYERIGMETTGGYPVLSPDPVLDAPETWYVYGNHSPLFSLAQWAGLKVLGPEGWETAWQEGRSPSGVGTDYQFEFAMRLPMFIASCLGMLALWWVIRIEGGRRAALMALLFYAIAPLAVLDAGLVNYEPPSILCVLLAYGFFAKMRRRDAADSGVAPRLFSKELLLTCLWIALGAAQTYGPLFFALPLCVAILLSRRQLFGLGPALGTAACIGVSALIPVLAHGLYARWALGDIQAADDLTARIGLLFEPLISGSVPLGMWLRLQYEHLVAFASGGLVDLGAVGVLFALILQADRMSGEAGNKARPNPAYMPLLLLAGGAAVMFGYYKHTADHLPAQSPFVLNLLPALAALAGLACVQMGDAVGRVFARSGKRHGGSILIAVLVALTFSTSLGTTKSLWQRWRGARADLPLPAVVGAQIHGLLPAGAVGLYPNSLGFTPAVSFYSARTLLPVTPEVQSFHIVEARLGATGLLERPRFLILPDKAPQNVELEAAALGEFFIKMAPEVAALPPIQGEGWRAWRLDPTP